LYYTDVEHDTPGVTEKDRDYDLICKASRLAAEAVLHEDVDKLAQAVRMSYQAQIDEGMASLVDCEECFACKYCGGGWGGYALYLFSSNKDRDNFITKHSQAREIEPFIKKY
jgi:hypothetical protein